MAELKKECATCRNWMPGKTDEAMRALRMAICRLQPVWTFLPPQSTCEQHAPASSKAVEARRAWLSGK